MTNKGIFSNYCGLGGEGPVRHEVDKLCKIHDEAYGEMQKKGINPYLKWNDADSDFLAGLKKLGPYRNDVKEFVTWVGSIGYAEAKYLLLNGHAPNIIEDDQDDMQLYLPAPESQLHLPAPEQVNHDMSVAQWSTAMTTTSKKRKGNDGAIAAEEGHGDLQSESQYAPGVEGQLDPIKHIWYRFPNSQTARLKWIYTQLIGRSASQSNNIIYAPSGSAYDQQLKRDVGTPNTYTDAAKLNTDSLPTVLLKTPQLIKYRMTSPYNIVSSDANNLSEPQWLGYFDSMYQYYHVIKTHWTLTFSIPAAGSLSSSNIVNAGNYSFYVYWKYTNFDDPPTQFTVDNGGKTGYEGTTLNLTPDDYDRMGGWNKIRLQQNSTHSVSRTITGEYVHGDCQMDVKLLGTDSLHSSVQATAEGWNVVKSTVPFPENLCVILVQDNAQIVTDTDIWVGIRSEIDYTIQFKDLVSKYKYPTQSTMIGGSADIGQYFFRGAQQIQTANAPTLAPSVATVGTYN